MDANFLLITPAVAKMYLDANDRNYRSLSPDRVNLYARDMKEGRWINNGEPIQIHQDGSLANGQHRLAAILKSGVSQTVLVVSNVPNDVEIYDIGKTRTTNEVAKAQGLQVVPAISGIITTVLGRFAPHAKVGTMEILEYFKAHSEMVNKAYNIGRRGADKCILAKAGSLAAVYCALRLGTVTEEQAIDFCTIANSGIPKEGKASTVPIMLTKTISEGIKDANGVVLSSSGWTIRRPLFEITYQALIEFKQEKSRSRHRFVANGNGPEILISLRNLDKKEGEGK